MLVDAQIALTHFAGRAGDHNDAAMVGSRLLAQALAERFGRAPVVVGTPRPALSTGWSEELESARAELVEVGDRFGEVLAAGHRPVTALGRCAVALATVPVVTRVRPDALVVWFDAHADLNTPGSTTTMYLGGLALSGPLGLWDSGLGAGLSADRTVLVGTRDVDPPEQDLVDSSDLVLVPPGPRLVQDLAAAVAGRPVYVHVDCDVLEPGTVPTDYEVPGGLTLDDLHACAEVLARSEVVGVELVELESRTGAEDLTPLVAALAPLL